MSAPEPSRHDRRLARHLRTAGSLLLDAARGRVATPIRARVASRSVEVLILVRPIGAASDPAAAPLSAGRWFSPTEQAIYDALAAGPLIGAAIARRMRVAYSSTLQTLLTNLVARGCLAREGGRRGYARVVPNSDISGER